MSDKGRNRKAEPLVGVGDHQLDALQAPPHQALEEAPYLATGHADFTILTNAVGNLF